jgi:hypothetical protein
MRMQKKHILSCVRCGAGALSFCLQLVLVCCPCRWVSVCVAPVAVRLAVCGIRRCCAFARLRGRWCRCHCAWCSRQVLVLPALGLSPALPRSVLVFVSSFTCAVPEHEETGRRCRCTALECRCAGASLPGLDLLPVGMGRGTGL